jgi:hypothetical protein
MHFSQARPALARALGLEAAAEPNLNGPVAARLRPTEA